MFGRLPHEELYIERDFFSCRECCSMSSNAVPVAVFLGSAVVLFCECLVETDPVGEAGFKDDLVDREPRFDQ